MQQEPSCTAGARIEGLLDPQETLARVRSEQKGPERLGDPRTGAVC